MMENPRRSNHTFKMQQREWKQEKYSKMRSNVQKPIKLKEQQYAKDLTPATKTALEVISPMPPAVENAKADHPNESKV